MMLALLVAAATVAVTVAHPTYYPDVDGEKWIERMKAGDLPPFMSFHIHCLFVSHDNSSVIPAMELRQKMIDHFDLAGTAPCNGTSHQGRVCMFRKYEQCRVLWCSPFCCCICICTYLTVCIILLYVNYCRKTGNGRSVMI